MNTADHAAMRRRILQSLPLPAAAVWSKPAVQAVLLPAHAGTTAGGGGG